MSVRRLDTIQPEGFAFTPANLVWAKETIKKYPDGKQASAVIPLLWRAQEQNEGWVTKPAMEYVASMLGMTAVQKLAHEAENLLNLARDGKLLLRGPVLELVFASVDTLKRQIAFGRTWAVERVPLPPDPSIPGLIAALRKAGIKARGDATPSAVAQLFGGDTSKAARDSAADANAPGALSSLLKWSLGPRRNELGCVPASASWKLMRQLTRSRRLR